MSILPFLSGLEFCLEFKEVAGIRRNGPFVIFQYLNKASIKCSILLSEVQIPNGYFSETAAGSEKRPGGQS